MKKTVRTLIKWALGAGLLLAFGLAGSQDRADAIIYTMPAETYREICDRLEADGVKPTDRRIADYYMDHYAGRD